MIKEITKEIYDRAIKNRNYIANEDKKRVWNMADLCGYGIYGDQVFEKMVNILSSIGVVVRVIKEC